MIYNDIIIIIIIIIIITTTTNNNNNNNNHRAGIITKRTPELCVSACLLAGDLMIIIMKIVVFVYV